MKTYTQKEVEEILSRFEADKLDCGDNSCRFSRAKGGMRTNGGCRCVQAQRNEQAFIYRGIAAPNLARQLLECMDKLEVVIKALEYYEVGSYVWDSADEDMDGNLTDNTIADSDGGQVASTALQKIKEPHK